MHLARPAARLPQPVKRAVRRYVPPRLWYGALRAAGYARAPIDVAPLRRIESEPLERLTNPAFLSAELLPAMGLNGASPELFPRELQPFLDRGVQHFQLPIQFGPYLAEVARRDVRSYLEIGVEHGGTFAITVEILRRFGPLARAVAVDLGPRPLVLSKWTRPEVSFVAADSQRASFRRRLRRLAPLDLVLIDGDHAADAFRHDFDSVRPSAPLIAVHDICEPNFPVGEVWRELRREHEEEFEFLEFVDQYPGMPQRFGIGLAVRRDAVRTAPS